LYEKLFQEFQFRELENFSNIIINYFGLSLNTKLEVDEKTDIKQLILFLDVNHKLTNRISSVKRI
jgi:hypothetical protein